MTGLLDTFDVDRLQTLIAGFREIRVAVLGDFFLDMYFDLDPALIERSVETGRYAHQVTGIRCAAGAAGTVVNNLAALGARELMALGITGQDGNGWELRQSLAALGCDITHLHAEPACMTPAYIKPCDSTRPGLDGEHDRYDIKNRCPLPAGVGETLLASLDAVLPHIDALIVMDQIPEEGCGVMSNALIAALADRAPQWPKIIFWADSRRRIHLYRNVIVKANQFELINEANPQPGFSVPEDVLATAAEALATKNGAPVFVTSEHRGVRVSSPASVIVPSVNVPGPIDSTGAGDAFTAGAVLALAAGATHAEAALVGNLAASVAIRQLGRTGTATPAELIDALASWRKQQL